MNQFEANLTYDNTIRRHAKAFQDHVLPELLEQAAEGEAVVYYSDDGHLTHNTKTGRGWIRKGRDFDVDCNSGRKRVNINGAINAFKPEHLVYDITDSINAQSLPSGFVGNY